MFEKKQYQPLMVCIGGWPGSGKTTIAGHLQHHLEHSVHLDSDAMRKKMFQIAITQKLPETAYSAENTKRLIAYAGQEVSKILKEGKDVIVSATFFDEDSRAYQQNIAEKANASFAGFMLEAPYEILQQRIRSRMLDSHAHNPSDADLKVLERIFTGDFGLYQAPWLTINADRHVADIVEEIKQRLAHKKSLVK